MDRVIQTSSLGDSILLDREGDLVEQVQNLRFLKMYKVLSVEEIDELNQYGKPLKWRFKYISLYGQKDDYVKDSKNDSINGGKIHKRGYGI